jgi:ferritin-like metal-binding protein YciE
MEAGEASDTSNDVRGEHLARGVGARCADAPAGNRTPAAAVMASARTRVHGFSQEPKEPRMGLFTKDIATMDDLLLHGLQDIYYAENQIVKSLPKMIEKATNRDLSKGLKDHLAETEKQVGRLEQVFKLLEKEPKGVKCPAIDGLIAEADDVAGEVADKNVLDAAVVGAAQAVEHYEIARYGTLIAWADALERDDIIRLLTTNLNEEKAADRKLSTVALRKGVNRRAAS